MLVEFSFRQSLTRLVICRTASWALSPRKVWFCKRASSYQQFVQAYASEKKSVSDGKGSAILLLVLLDKMWYRSHVCFIHMNPRVSSLSSVESCLLYVMLLAAAPDRRKLWRCPRSHARGQVFGAQVGRSRHNSTSCISDTWAVSEWQCILHLPRYYMINWFHYLFDCRLIHTPHSFTRLFIHNSFFNSRERKD